MDSCSNRTCEIGSVYPQEEILLRKGQRVIDVALRPTRDRLIGLLLLPILLSLWEKIYMGWPPLYLSRFSYVKHF